MNQIWLRPSKDFVCYINYCELFQWPQPISVNFVNLFSFDVASKSEVIFKKNKVKMYKKVIKMNLKRTGCTTVGLY